MFAPPVAKPKTKSAEPQRATVAAQWPSQAAVDQAHRLQRSIGNQAVLRLLAQHGLNFLERRDPHQEMAGLSAQKAAPGTSWDFSQIPLFSPGRTNQPQEPFPFGEPPLPGPIQAKLVVGAVDDPLELRRTGSRTK
jgi:hypothetical protein